MSTLHHSLDLHFKYSKKIPSDMFVPNYITRRTTRTEVPPLHLDTYDNDKATSPSIDDEVTSVQHRGRWVDMRNVCYGYEGVDNIYP